MRAAHLPYGENAPVRLHYDIVTIPGYPHLTQPRQAELEMGKAVIAIDHHPRGQERLSTAEASALSLTAAGLRRSHTIGRLRNWHPTDNRRPFDSLRTKFGIPPDADDAERLIVASGFRREYLTAKKPLALSLPSQTHQRFLTTNAFLTEGLPLCEVGARMNVSLDNLNISMRQILIQAGLRHIDRSASVIVTLAGAAGEIILDKDKAASEIQSEPEMRWRPFENETIELGFTGQPEELSEPNINIGSVSSIRVCGAEIAVHDIPFINGKGEADRLNPRQLAAFVIAILSRNGKEATRLSAYSGQGCHAIFTQVYRKLTPAFSGTPPHSLLLPSILFAYQRNLLSTITPPNISRLDGPQQERLRLLARHLGEGRSGPAMESKLNWGKGSANYSNAIIREALGGISRATLVLLGLARSTPEELAEYTIVEDTHDGRDPRSPGLA